MKTFLFRWLRFHALLQLSVSAPYVIWLYKSLERPVIRGRLALLLTMEGVSFGPGRIPAISGESAWIRITRLDV